VVVLESPVVDEQLGLKDGVEALEVEQLAAKVAVEGFDERILPGRSRFDLTGS